MASNKETAESILRAVGGKNNIVSVTHCMTRLRFKLVDETIPDDEKVKDISGVVGVNRSAGQYQVIIGTKVSKVYEELCSIDGLNEAEVNKKDNSGESEKEKLNAKIIGKKILNYMAGCMTPLIPMLLAGGLFSSINGIFGPGFLNLYPENSNLYILFNILYTSALHFLPVLTGVYAAKQLDIPPVLGAYSGCILIAPSFIDMAKNGGTFNVYGIPCGLNDYSQTVIPVMLSVFAMSLIYKGIKRILPDVLSITFTPFLTMLVSVPIMLCLLAPLGSNIGNLLSSSLNLFGTKTGFIGVAVISAIWEFLVLSGMHLALIVPMMASFFETGVGSGPMNAGAFATWAIFGVAIGAALRLKKKEKKSEALGFFLSGMLGGVTEPTLYGICFRYNRCFITMAIGGFIGGAYAGITDVCAYVMSSANFLSVISFTGGSTVNFINGVIACVLSLLSAAVATYVFGFSKGELDN